MFTGIITSTGTLTHLHVLGADRRMVIAPTSMLPTFAHLTDGESIAVNGACLSVERHDRHSFTVYASAQTLSCTTLGALTQGSLVNLERALAVGDRLGGHLVSGHVDCVATVVSCRRQGASLGVRVRFPAHLKGQVVNKGSVTLDGISLTITTCTDQHLEVNLIPDTRLRTTVSQWTEGSRINMETDILGKYVERMLHVGGHAQAEEKPTRSLDHEFLRQHGFLHP